MIANYNEEEHLESEKEKIQLIGNVLLTRGFKDWLLFFFKAIEKTDFILEPIHNQMFQLFDDIIYMKKNRININCPPRTGKTTLLVYYVAYCFAIQPKAQFIYTSFNQDLLRENSERLGRILRSKVYQDMYGSQVGFEEQGEMPEDAFWEKYLGGENKEFKISARKITNQSGGIVIFNSIGSTITGFGFGLRNFEKFGGACLDYNEVIRTDKGDLKIGDIVEKKIQCKVLSYNLKTKQFEYKPIDNYIKNEDSKFLEIQLSNGSSIQCTPDHKFYINNQWKEAKDLNFYTDSIATFSNSFNLLQRQIKLFHTLYSCMCSVSNKIKNISINLFHNMSCIYNAIRKIFKTFFCFNRLNSSYISIKSFSNFFQSSLCLTNIGNISRCQFTSTKNQTSKFNSILHIFTFCSPTQIRQSVVSRNRIQMSCLCFWKRLIANKTCQDQMMYHTSFYTTIFRKINKIITGSGKMFFKMFTFQKIFMPYTINNLSVIRIYFTHIRNFIKTFKPNNIFINNIITIHNKPSYCLSIQDNHNMFIVKSNINYMGKYINQLILTHNCILDDANKPSDTYFYERARQKTFDYFRQILLTRANNSRAPIINVQQRLHIDDITGYLQREYNYYTLSLPLVNEDGSCNLPKQYSLERIKELQKDNYLFQSQYQQKPFLIGGNVIKSEWFKNYKILPKLKAVYISADTAFETKKRSDYSVFQLWGKTELTTNSDYYLIDMIRGKWESPELLQKLIDFYNKYKKKFMINCLYIENKASGIGLIQQIRRMKIPVKEVNPVKDKYKRLSDVLPMIESGYVYIPEQANWRLDFIKECEEFKRDMTHPHDDMVDSMVIGIGIDVVKPLSIYDYLY